MADAFAAQLRRHAQEVQELEGAQAREFLRLLRQLQDELRGRLAVLPADAAIDAVKLRQVQLETEAGIRVLETKTSQAFVGGQKDAVDLAIEHLSGEMSLLSKTFDAHQLTVSIEAAKVFADPGQGLLASHFETSVKRYGLDLLNGVRRRLFIGMRAGDSIGDVVSGITGAKGSFGPVSRSNAERLVRTETSQAYGAAQHSAIKQTAHHVPGLKKTWLHIGSYLCKTCGPLHGTTRPLDGTWTITIGKRSRKVAHAPGHPNCTCRVVAMKPSWRAGMEKLGYLEKQKTSDEPGRASL